MFHKMILCWIIKVKLIVYLNLIAMVGDWRTWLQIRKYCVSDYTIKKLAIFPSPAGGRRPLFPANLKHPLIGEYIS
jgi:hypothetical protein